MYSGSNSYLGGANSARAGQQQFGQPQQSFQPNPQFTNQPTGFGQAPLQQQYTGYPGGNLQAQPTGYSGQQATQYGQQQQQPLSQPYGGFQQPQQTGFPQQQPTLQAAPQNVSQAPTQPPLQRPQPTGMTSSDMANSFRSTPAAPKPPSTTPSKVTSKIPSIRLSFITAQDQAKFEQLFKSATGSDQALSGDKAKDLLLRSKLDGNSLAQIWTLSDTTKSGQLLFPEFALAMYLCNLRLTGKDLPAVLPEVIRNEVSSMVDIISFGVPDDQPASRASTNAPNFSEVPKIQQPQAQNPSNQQLLSALTAQPTGYQFPQQTGYQQPPFNGVQSQPTGYAGGMPQATGYTGPRPPLPPMPTGFGSTPALSSQQTGFQMAAPLNAQPTGRPGQWGLVNAPASGLPNLQALQQQMMPQPGREAGFSAQGLRGNATVPWAVTKDEKKIYDDMFKAWDGFGKGFISGAQAIEIFGQSGLEKGDLERVWTLSDPNNKGRLNLDEFAVAMHLIYRRLNGYPVPNTLPPELIPPSTRNISDSIGTMKNLLSQDAQERKSSGAFLQPQQTGVSYLKSRSFRGNGSPQSNGRKDATVFKNNDDDVGYKSSARRRVGRDADARSPSPAISEQSSLNADEMSIEQLRKAIREKQVLLDAMDFEDENNADEEDALDRKDRKESEELFRRIRKLQEDIDSHPNSATKIGDTEAERRTLQRQLRSLQDRLPELASQVRRCERAIAETALQLFRAKDAKAHPGSSTPITGTGPGGAVTESDRLKARARAMMQQRSAALSGKKIDVGDDGTAAAARLEQESKRLTREREDNERMVKDVEDSVTEFARGLESSLKEGAESASDEHERRRWVDGLGVEDEVKDFIYELQRSSRASKIRHEERSKPSTRSDAFDEGARTQSPATTSSQSDRFGSSRSPTTASPQTTGSSYSSYRTAEERAAFIKQQAEQRMAERLAALGLKAPGSKAGAETAAQRAERERNERAEKLRQAEAEDARREQERQSRLQDESIAPPSAVPSSGKSKPPPPASRKLRGDVVPGQDSAPADAQRVEESKEAALREEQAAAATETQQMEQEEARQERELQKQREDAEASLRALEEQVKAGKLKKSEEKKRREAAKKDAAERESRLAAQRAEIEAAKERERQLRAQLEDLDDEDSSDEESAPAVGHSQGAVEDKAPVESAPPPPVAPPLPPVTAPGAETQPAAVASPPEKSKNPFFMSMNQKQASSSAPPAAVISPASEKRDTNPFHNLTQQDLAKQQKLPDPGPTTNPARSKPVVVDDWDSAGASSSSDDDDDDDRPQGGSAKQLASILFGTMAPPRPLSSMGNAQASPSTPSSPAPRSGPIAAPPPAPPLPSVDAPPPPPLPPSGPSGAPPAPPPPPPPGAPPSAGPPAPPPMPPPSAAGPGDRSGLLQQIQLGKGLRKVETKDRSASSVAGRVL